MFLNFLKDYKLSDDITFRFSNKGWAEFPLTANKFTSWLHNINGDGELITIYGL